MDPGAFYQLKAALLEIALLDERYDVQRAALVTALQAVLRAAGLDPTGVYRLDDVTHEVRLIEPSAAGGIGGRPPGGA